MAESQSNSLPPLEERQLVTFALFAYNQEKYIRDAIEGAFAQTYEPLEIILSDDCSTDRTFEIMQEMVAVYKGPHRVRARRSTKNVGTLSHVLEVGGEARGSFMVVAAGDDISRPERTATTVAYLTQLGSTILSAACDEFIDRPSEITGRREPVTTINDPLIHGRPLVQQIHGATAAYCTSFLKSIPIPRKRVLLEDYAFQVIAFWKGCKVDTINDSVIYHRIHNENIGPKKYTKKIRARREHEKILCNHYKRLIETMGYLSYIHSSISISEGERRGEKAVISDAAFEYASFRARWMNLTLREKIKFYRVSRLFDNPRGDALRSLGTRMFYAITRFI